MNSISKLIINGKDYSGNSIYGRISTPVKFANLLDEQLNELSITIKHAEEKVFKPMTKVNVRLSYTSKVPFDYSMVEKILSLSDEEFTYNSSTQKWKGENGTTAFINASNQLVQEKDETYLIANDKAVETPLGSGRYTHELYLIEYTKIAEGFICDTITFTNPLGNTFNPRGGLEFTVLVNSEQKKSYRENSYSEQCPSPVTIKRFYDMYVGVNTPSAVLGYNGNYYDTCVKSVLIYQNNLIVWGWGITRQVSTGKFVYYTVKNNVYSYGSEVQKVNKYNDYNYDIPSNTVADLQSGTYTIKYEWNSGTNQTAHVNSSAFAIFENRLPKEKYTVTGVVNRVLDTIEPRLKSDKNRFTFNKEQSDKYSNVIAPEFTFTKMTLREILQQIGGFIHARPYISGNNEIKFIPYGDITKSNVSSKKLVFKQFKSDINDWCTAIDSSAENLVNQLDYAGGVSVEPARNAYITPRTENTTARLAQDNTTFIPTSLPIYKFGENTKVCVCYIPGKGYGQWDITPYIFESTDYNSVLSGTTDTYPYSRSYALYYTQGQKNIYGLFYKAPDAVSSALKEYSIVNILRRVTGDSTLSITGDNLFQIAFSISYMPIYSTRVKTTKQTTIGYTPRTIAYNQEANVVESRYYGENLKGVVARLGNIERTCTYHLAYLSDIPVVGRLFDDNYYISAVSVELLPTVIKCTVGLSKDFNRLSQYVGVSSNKRMWEISERQSVERQSLYTEYMLISLKKNNNDDDTAFYDLGLNEFFDYPSYRKPVTAAKVFTYTKSEKALSVVSVPAISTALGTSIIFTASLPDNYSAGQQIEKVNENGISGWWGNYKPYTDYYGECYYLDVYFFSGYTDFGNSSTSGIDNANKLPSSPNGARISPATPCVDISAWRYRKDNREIPQINYELSAVSDDENLIIGSGLMRNCTFANDNPLTLEVYGFDKRINKLNSDLSDRLNGADAHFLGNVTFTTGLNSHLSLPYSDYDYVAWAIVTRPTLKTINVSDEDNNNTVQTIRTGGELVIGGNKPYSQCKTIYVTLKRSIENL